MTETQLDPDFADVVGVNVRSQMLQHLAELDEPKKQYQIAEDLSVSQASVSRSTQELVDANIVEKDDEDRLSIHPDARAGIGMFRQVLGAPADFESDTEAEAEAEAEAVEDEDGDLVDVEFSE